jgi:glycosyltransferase AglD
MKSKRIFIRLISLVLIIVFLILSFNYLDLVQLWLKSKEFFINHPKLLAMISICYFTSFLLRAIAWKKYLSDKVELRHCLQGVLLSLFINHIIPIKLGDVIRIGMLLKKEKHITLDEATHSVVIMRLLDILTLIFFTLIGLFLNASEIIFKVPIWILLTLFFICILSITFMRKIYPSMYEKHLLLLKQGLFTPNILLIVPLIIISWMLEGSVVWGVMKSFDNDFSIWKSIWVNSITVGGQVFQITPGGITTYESIMSLTLVTLGIPMIDAYQIAFVSHAYKFIFSYVIGFILLLQAPKAKWNEMKELLALRGGKRA